MPVVNELVTNAVVHARTDLWFGWSCADPLVIVRDGSPPLLRQVGFELEGRGRTGVVAVNEKPRTRGLTKPDLMGAEFVGSRERPGPTRRGGAGGASIVLIVG